MLPSNTGLRAELIVRPHRYAAIEIPQRLLTDGGPVTEQQLKPLPVDFMLVVHNERKETITFRHGGDDQYLEIELKGPGVQKVQWYEPCTTVYMLGERVLLEPGAKLELPIKSLKEGKRCRWSGLFWTKPGTYQLQVSLQAAYQLASQKLTDRGIPVHFQSSPFSLTVTGS